MDQVTRYSFSAVQSDADLVIQVNQENVMRH